MSLDEFVIMRAKAILILPPELIVRLFEQQRVDKYLTQFNVQLHAALQECDRHTAFQRKLAKKFMDAPETARKWCLFECETTTPNIDAIRDILGPYAYTYCSTYAVHVLDCDKQYNVIVNSAIRKIKPIMIKYVSRLRDRRNGSAVSRSRSARILPRGYAFAETAPLEFFREDARSQQDPHHSPLRPPLTYYKVYYEILDVIGCYNLYKQYDQFDLIERTGFIIASINAIPRYRCITG